MAQGQTHGPRPRKLRLQIGPPRSLPLAARKRIVRTNRPRSSPRRLRIGRVKLTEIRRRPCWLAAVFMRLIPRAPGNRWRAGPENASRRRRPARCFARRARAPQNQRGKMMLTARSAARVSKFCQAPPHAFHNGYMNLPPENRTAVASPSRRQLDRPIRQSASTHPPPRLRQARSFRCLHEMPSFDLVEAVVPAVTRGHRQLQLLPFNLTPFQARLRGQDIIQRGETKASSRPEKQAEVLGMAIRCPDSQNRICAFRKVV